MENKEYLKLCSLFSAFHSLVIHPNVSEAFSPSIRLLFTSSASYLFLLDRIVNSLLLAGGIYL